ncbi:MAG: hypothetical protein D3917_21010 [Candidatus Electrothrix sp. AX5]|nr:hypothetical protein [Candidatus Electrothrix sp. AX5]
MRRENRDDCGFASIDALHLASAEVVKADFFCTCDDKFLKKAKGIDDLGIKTVRSVRLAVF